jgi:hypothetical protein
MGGEANQFHNAVRLAAGALLTPLFWSTTHGLRSAKTIFSSPAVTGCAHFTKPDLRKRS